MSPHTHTHTLMSYQRKRVPEVVGGGDGSRADSFRCGCTIAHEIGGFHWDSGSVKPLPVGIAPVVYRVRGSMEGELIMGTIETLGMETRRGFY